MVHEQNPEQQVHHPFPDFFRVLTPARNSKLFPKDRMNGDQSLEEFLGFVSLQTCRCGRCSRQKGRLDILPGPGHVGNG